jgi:uncharacterized Rmd1/YagE family protein
MDHVGAPGTVAVRALLLGERLDARGIERTGSRLPGLVVLADGPGGTAFAFRWGALVTAGMTEEATGALAARLASRIAEPLPQPVAETAALRVEPGAEGEEADGVVRLAGLDLPRLAVVAEALARSALLAHQEAQVERTLDTLEPTLAALRRGRLAVRSPVMLRAIGEAIAARSRAGARVDTAAKPELLWEHPERAGLYAQLAGEWELAERSAALAEKLTLIRETSETLLSLVEARRSRGLELAVVLLIAMELATALYGLFKP